MARHGENIRKRKDGRWEGRYPVYSDAKGKKLYRSVYGRSYDEVREKLTAQKNLLNKSGIETTTKTSYAPNLKEIMLEDAAGEWLAEVKCKRKQSTYVKYRLLLQKHLENNFARISLADLTTSCVEERLSGRLTDTTHRSIYCVLNQILKFVSQKYLMETAVLKCPASIPHSKPMKPLTQNEQKRLISVLYTNMDNYKMAVLLCLFTGIRLGELCALKWADIDFEGKILSVNRTVQRLYADGYPTKTVLMETAPKSEYSRREIPLTAVMLELLIRFRNGREYILGGDGPTEPRTVQYRFKKILKEAELPDINFHILRHTFSTNCIEGGTDVKSLSEMLGHSDVQITLNRYVHPSMDMKRQYMDSLSRFYGQIQGQVG
ncbi:MAG: site-specific integrase [Roseburia sp.]|nr:site-specific integrase [Roseburia sp.]